MNTPQKSFRGVKSDAPLFACLAVAALLFFPNHGTAQDITLTNGGSTASVDLGSSVGMDGWTVDTVNQNQLDSQWFYYSINGGAVQGINAISPVSYFVTGDSILNALYSNGQISIAIQYQLQGTGPGSGSADILESITATNLSGSTMSNLKIFEYSNFNLLQSGVNSININADLGPPPTFPIVGYNGVTQTSGSTALSEAIDSPDAGFAEAGTSTNVLSDVLADGPSGHDLNDDLSAANEGNVAWAFEWSQSVNAGGMVDILKDKTLSIATVPEPSTIAMITLGLGAIGLMRRRQSS